MKIKQRNFVLLLIERRAFFWGGGEPRSPLLYQLRYRLLEAVWVIVSVGYRHSLLILHRDSCQEGLLIGRTGRMTCPPVNHLMSLKSYRNQGLPF